MYDGKGIKDESSSSRNAVKWRRGGEGKWSAHLHKHALNKTKKRYEPVRDEKLSSAQEGDVVWSKVGWGEAERGLCYNYDCMTEGSGSEDPTTEHSQERNDSADSRSTAQFDSPQQSLDVESRARIDGMGKALRVRCKAGAGFVGFGAEYWSE